MPLRSILHIAWGILESVKRKMQNRHMKTFSEQEQKILKYIVLNRNSNTFILANVFNEWFDETGVLFDLKTGDVVYDSERLGNDPVNKILSDEHGVIEIALLVKYLVDKGYIYVIKDTRNEINLNQLGKNLSNSKIFHELPKDIVKIVQQSLYRVFVSYELVEIVQNNFQSKEAQQLQVAVSQLSHAQDQLKIARKQLETVKLQTDELKKQTKEVHEQTNKIQQQLDETKEQTILAQKQTKEAQEQTEEAQEQTKSAKKQTWLALLALICAIISILQPTCSNENKYRKEVISQLEQTNVGIAECIDHLNSHADSLVAISEIVVLQTDSIIKLEQNNLKIVNKTNGILQSLKKSVLQLDR